MIPKELRLACDSCIARSFTSKVFHLNLTQAEGRAILVELLTAYNAHYHGVLSQWSLKQQLYKSFISLLRKRINPPVFLLAMLLFCPKVTIDQIAMVADRGPDFGMDTGLYLSLEECSGMEKVLDEYQKQQILKMSLQEEEDTVSFTLPTTCLVLEGIYFAEPDFLMHILQKMPNLQHVSLQHNITKEIMMALSMHCKLLESLCLLESRTEASVLEKDIFPIFFGIPPSTSYSSSENLLNMFATDKYFREICEFQFSNLQKLDIDELFFDEDMIHDIYTLTLLLQPKLRCFGKHTGLTKRIITNYKKLWSIMHNKPESEATLQLFEARFVDSISVLPNHGTLELNYWAEVAPMFKNLESVELQKSLWSNEEIAKFCHLFNKKVQTFSLNKLPLSDMSCLSDVTHLRLTLHRHYSFDKMHLILDCCQSLKTLSIHPTFFDVGAIRNRLQDQPHIFNEMEFEELEAIERQMLIDVMVVGIDVEDHGLEGDFIPPREWVRDFFPNLIPLPSGESARMSKKRLREHHNLTALRIASLCEAGEAQSENFLRELLERLPNLRQLCLGMWLGGLNHRFTFTADALVSVITDSNLKVPLLPHLTQLCCLPSGTNIEMRTSLAALVERLPSLHTLVFPCLDNFMLGPTLHYFRHTNIDIQYKCATEQVFSSWEPEH